MSKTVKLRLLFLFIVFLAFGAAYVATPKNLSIKIYKWQATIAAKFPYHLGLDLQGGTHLIYEADMKDIAANRAGDAMDGVRDVIERRVNLFGVTEPLVQIEGKNRLVVELAGIKEVEQAIKMIGETPFLEFREESTREQAAAFYKQQTGKDMPAQAEGPFFLPTALTGKDLARSDIRFNQTTGAPEVDLEFNDRGKQLFADMTTKNVGKRIAIYLDGGVITAPTVQEPIKEGKAVISGKFTVDEAKTLVKRLNAGALPVPIKLISQQTIGATLGQDSLAKSLKAGIYGFLLVALFMILYYRLPGFLASAALVIYTLIVLAIFNLIPVTLTLAGIAGLILSIGMAVDANVLIFERMREELAAGRSLNLAIEDGFSRAWPSIRDSNLTTLITALALFWFGSGTIKGFAIALSIGILVSMFSAIIITKTFLQLILTPKIEKYKQLF